MHTDVEVKLGEEVNRLTTTSAIGSTNSTTTTTTTTTTTATTTHTRTHSHTHVSGNDLGSSHLTCIWYFSSLVRIPLK